MGTSVTADQMGLVVETRQLVIVYLSNGTVARSPPCTAALMASARAPQLPEVAEGMDDGGLVAVVVAELGAVVVVVVVLVVRELVVVVDPR